MTQPGYDELAKAYADAFPEPYQSPLEHAAIEAFANHVAAQPEPRLIIDIGSGLGHVTQELSTLGFDTVGVEPSAGMRALAAAAHPERRFLDDDAHLAREAGNIRAGALLARYSLIHVDPESLTDVLRAWATRLSGGSHILIAGQATERSGHEEFDHRVARAWRWNPDSLVHLLRLAGFDEIWRTMSRPDDDHRFPEFHLAAIRRPTSVE